MSEQGESSVRIDEHGMRITREAGGGWWHFSRVRPEGHRCEACKGKGSVATSRNSTMTCPACAESLSCGYGEPPWLSDTSGSWRAKTLAQLELARVPG